MPKSKLEYLDQIDYKVCDLAHEFIKSTVTTITATHIAGITTLTVSSNSGFAAGDTIYLNDGTIKIFTAITEVSSTNVIKVSGDYSAFAIGGNVKKNDAQQYLDEALLVYSKYRPLVRKEKVTVSAAAHEFALPAEAGFEWQQEFSQIQNIEYPVDYNPIELLPEKDFDIILNDSSAYKLRTRYDLEIAYRITYTIGHKFNGDNPYICTANDVDFYCIANIAAGIYLLALAARYGQSVAPFENADTVNYDTKPDQYRRLAKVLFGQAANWLGINVSDLDGTDLEQQASSSNQEIEYLNTDKKETLFHSGINPVVNYNTK